jgi:hypothetical protein
MKGAWTFLRAILRTLVGRGSFWLALVQTSLILALFLLLRQRTALLMFESWLFSIVTAWLNPSKLLSRPNPNIGIWFLAAMIGNLITTIFVFIQMMRTRRPGRASIASGVGLGILIAIVSVIGFPMLYLGWDAAYVTALLSTLYCMFDLIGFVFSDDKRELKEYSTYFSFLDLPTALASYALISLFAAHGLPGTCDFVIGASGAMLFLLSTISAISALWLSFDGLGLGNHVRAWFGYGAPRAEVENL